jgi:hypothetical protein
MNTSYVEMYSKMEVNKIYLHCNRKRIIEVVKRTPKMVYIREYGTNNNPIRKKVFKEGNGDESFEWIQYKNKTYFSYMEMESFKIIHERHMLGEFTKLLNDLVQKNKIIAWIQHIDDEYHFKIKFYNKDFGDFKFLYFNQICYKKDILFV